MRTARTIALHTAASLFSSAFAYAAAALYLAMSGGLFAFRLVRGEGGGLDAGALWAWAAAAPMPVLCALATMRLVAGERAAGRLDLLFVAPVRDRDIVIGKFAGAMAFCLAGLCLSLAVPLAILPHFADVQPPVSLARMLPGFAAVAMQTALWCATGLFASACCSNAAVAAASALVATAILPRAAWAAALEWMPALRTRLPMPFTEADVLNASAGIFSSASVVFYAVFSSLAVFAAVKAFAFSRLAGRGARTLRVSTVSAVALAALFSVLVSALALRTDAPFEVRAWADGAGFSDRTRQILSEVRGDVSVTCFLSRRSPRYDAVARLLRGIEAVARKSAGARFETRYVDPHWDIGAAARLVRGGVAEGTVVFSSGRRRIAVPAAEADERSFASAVLHLANLRRRARICWLSGHGETPFDSYDTVAGMSDIARDLRREGYELSAVDLASGNIPGDCAALVVAGARRRFSQAENSILDAYLRNGGRILALVSHDKDAGAASVLEAWGAATLPCVVASPRTFSGADVVATNVSGHAVVRPLAGSSFVFESASPVVPVRSSGDAAGGADETKFTPLVSTDAAAWGESSPETRPWSFDPAVEPGGPFVLAAAVERGGGASADIAFRPTRIVVIGDPSFAANGALAVRANANRDLVLNAVAWLAGVDAIVASGGPSGALSTGMARDRYLKFSASAVLLCPAVLLLFAASMRLCGRFRG